MTTVPAFIKMFPEPDTVFATDIEQHSKYLFPLFSVDLSAVNPDWTGQVHMLQFNEDPYNRATSETFNEYCQDCMLGFDIQDSKYSFKTSFRFFDLTDKWKQWFDQTKASFNKTKKYFTENGTLPKRSYGAAANIFEQFLGEPDWIQGGSAPLDPEGTPMTFISRVYTGNYTNDSCDKDIYLFYSHSCKLAVLLYQIT